MSAGSRLAATWRGAQDLTARLDRWQHRHGTTALPVAVAVGTASTATGGGPRC